MGADPIVCPLYEGLALRARPLFKGLYGSRCQCARVGDSIKPSLRAGLGSFFFASDGCIVGYRASVRPEGERQPAQVILTKAGGGVAFPRREHSL
jgi:hypothetical protein